VEAIVEPQIVDELADAGDQARVLAAAREYLDRDGGGGKGSG